MRQHGALAGVIKLRLVTISLQMAVVAVIFRCHHRNIGTPVFRYQLVWMPRRLKKKHAANKNLMKIENMKIPLCFFNVHFLCVLFLSISF